LGRRAPIRRSALALAVLAAVAGPLILAPSAGAGALTPESGGSPNADDIAALYKLALYAAIPVFLAVEIAVVWFLIRYRHRRGAVAAQIRGNTRLEIGWTVGAGLILVVLTVFTFAKLPQIQNPPAPGAAGLGADGGGALYAAVDQPPPPGGRALNIDVNGQQYVWRYTYPNGAFSYDEMVVPTDTTVTLDIRAQDVIHSWWIPALGGKFDAVPGGYVNKTWFKISEPDVYEGQCAELCGRNHANMLARVRAVSPDRYQAWLADRKRQIDAANQAAATQRERLSPTASGG
jgi:cytochrome c oxidase subunit II